jgi:hypothetical protein
MKTEPKSKLFRLPPAQTIELRKWLVNDGVTYATAQARLLARFKIRTSTASISRFHQVACVPIQRRRMEPQYTIELHAVIKRRGRVIATTAYTLPTKSKSIRHAAGLRRMLSALN